MSENKFVRIVTDSAVLVGIAAAVGYVAKKVMKEKGSFIGDPSSGIDDYGKWVVVVSVSTYIKIYLEDQKILPKSF